MSAALTRAAWICLAGLSAGVSPLLAQMQDNVEKQMTCENGGNNGDQARHCEIREQSLPGIGRMTLDAGRNGGATVKGWLRSDVLVRARVEAWADTESAASSITSQVYLNASGGIVQANGPTSVNNSGWSVSYEVFVPQTTDLNLKTYNGGLTISDVRGQIQFEVKNGGVRLKRIAGDVTGSSQNGGIQVDLAGGMWDGRQLDVKTTNGGVTLTMPAYYSAHVQAETHNGRINSDFPVTMQGNILQENTKPRKLDFNVGSGGPLIHVSTTNGGVTVKRAES